MIKIAPGNHNLQYIHILNEDEKKHVDSGPVATSVVIKESIDLYGTRAVITVADQNDVLGKLPILGHERVVLAWSTDIKPGIKGKTSENPEIDPEPRVEVFRITNINAVTPDNDEVPGLKYAISLVSEFAYLQEFHNVDQAFSNTVSNCLKTIHNKVLKEPLGEIKIEDPKVFELVKVDDTDNVVDFIAPSDTPFTIIQMLQSWAFNTTYPSSAYYYFQNKDGFNFRVIDSMAKDESGPEKKFYYGPDGQTSLGKNFELNRINNFVVHNRGNAFELASEGRLRNQVAEIDFIKKNVTLSEYSYEDYVSKYNIFGSKVFAGKKFMSSIGSIPTETHWVFKDGSRRENNLAQALKHKWAMYKLIYNNVLSIVVPGSSNLTAGDVLDINIPQQITVTDKKEIPLDNFLSGKYIAKDVDHVFNSEGYTIQINLIRTGSKLQTNEI